MFGEEDDIVTKDRKRFPNCGYSTSIEQSCGRETEGGSKQGEYVCNTIKKVYRQCPNQSPVLIMQKKSENSDMGLFGGLFSSLEKRGGRKPEGQAGGDFDNSLNEIQKNFEEVMGHRDLKGVIDLMREAHGEQMKAFGGGDTERDTFHKATPKHPHYPHSPHGQHFHDRSPHQRQLPFHEDYDKAVDEAMADIIVDNHPDKNNAKRRGTASGSAQKV
jgi:hypothetical protein